MTDDRDAPVHDTSRDDVSLLRRGPPPARARRRSAWSPEPTTEEGRRRRRRARWATALVVTGGLIGPFERELVCTHTFVAYHGQALEPEPVEFPTETVRARGWLWPLPFAGFALLWIAVLGLLRERVERVHPWLLPLLLGWSATAMWILQQKLAAPSAIVQPFGLERFLWPAGMALAIRLALTTKKFLVVLLQLALASTALRLPAALFSKIASDQHLGTSLDVSGITQIVHPMTRMQFDQPLSSGSSEQQFWLIWAEHVFVFPAFHVMSFAGVAFAFWLMQKHADTPE